jgi:NDP-sugar pyrophosphorylase family protein
VFAANHQAELIKAYFGDGSKWGVEITYSVEPMPLGTIGPLRLLAELPENFLIMNGDVLSDLDHAAFFAHHLAHASLFTISSYVRTDRSQYGVLETSDGQLTGFREKPLLTTEVSMGVYAASRGIIPFIPENKPYGFDQLMIDMLATDRPPRVHRFDGHWLDIGIPADYERATVLFNENRAQFLPGE